ncbi:MAG: hypothetical protein U1F43_09715 [Myxococcota bacterium]
MLVARHRLVPSLHRVTLGALAALATACGSDGSGKDSADGATSADAADTSPTSDVSDATGDATGASDATDATSGDDTTVADSDASTDTSGGLAHITLIAGRTPVDLSPDGNTALIADPAALNGDVYGLDTNTGAQTLLTQIGDPAFTFATGIASDGRLSALHGSPVVAGVWAPNDGWTDIDSPFHEGCDLNVAGAWDISADGATVVGFFWNGCTTEAFRWNDASGSGVVTPLAVLGSSSAGSSLGPVNRATVVSDDGQVIGGSAQNGDIDRAPAMWRADGTGQLLAPDDHDNPGEVLALSEDGAVAAGVSANNGFIWTAADGFLLLGKPANGLPSDVTHINTMAANGKLVFGSSGDPFFGLVQAVVWDETNGMRILQDLAVANGAVIPEGTLLTNVLAASTDGSIVLGSAVDELGTPSAFVLVLATSAYGL